MPLGLVGVEERVGGLAVGMKEGFEGFEGSTEVSTGATEESTTELESIPIRESDPIGAPEASTVVISAVVVVVVVLDVVVPFASKVISPLKQFLEQTKKILLSGSIKNVPDIPSHLTEM